MKPPFSYYGGKTNLADLIVSLLPEHQHYIEPFAGSLAVLFAKPPSKMETVNDLDGDLMNFWTQLRDNGEGLQRACALTPHSRAEHAAATEPVSDDLERARRTWVRLTQGRSSSMRTTGWRHFSKPDGTSLGFPKYLAGYVDRMTELIDRLHHVSLECRPALDLIEKYGRERDSLIYLDPPYLGSVRTRNYRHELTSESDHGDLLEAAKGCKASVVISGYPSPLYDSLLSDWARVDVDTKTGNGKGDQRRVEVLWANRDLIHADTLDFGEASA
jgi:DNA adenine methylase